MKWFESSSRCPKCNFDLENRQSDVFPNFLLNELVAKHKSKLEKLAKAGSNAGLGTFASADHELLKKVVDPNSSMTLPECEYMIQALSDKKDELLNESLLVEYKLLHEFLTQLKRIKVS